MGGYLAEPKNQRQMEFLTGLVELETEFYGPRFVTFVIMFI